MRFDRQLPCHNTRRLSLWPTWAVLGRVAWPSGSKALDLRSLTSQWAKVRASSNLAATIHFLPPSLMLSRTAVSPFRSARTKRWLHYERYLDPTPSTADLAVSTTPPNLTEEQRNVLQSALRVDQAGELAADYIYRGQLAILGRDPRCGPLIQVSHSFAAPESKRSHYFFLVAIENVGSRKVSSGRHEQAAGTA